MLNANFHFPQGATILCLGAHCDDIEIGCAGTLIEIARCEPSLRIHWIVFSGDAIREAETRHAAAKLLADSTVVNVEVHRFRASYFPDCWSAIKDVFGSLESRFSPDLLLTHGLHDRHQDHRILAELTWNTFRDHTVLEYEIPKFEGDLQQQNFLVPLCAATVDRKIDLLMRCFQSQHSRSWFDADVFRGLMRLRGVECNSPSGFAEAFHARKLRYTADFGMDQKK